MEVLNEPPVPFFWRTGGSGVWNGMDPLWCQRCGSAVAVFIGARSLQLPDRLQHFQAFATLLKAPGLIRHPEGLEPYWPEPEPAQRIAPHEVWVYLRALHPCLET
jgi:hypothetical protein